jgi:hypothetical protein
VEIETKEEEEGNAGIGYERKDLKNSSFRQVTGLTEGFNKILDFCFVVSFRFSY